MYSNCGDVVTFCPEHSFPEILFDELSVLFSKKACCNTSLFFVPFLIVIELGRFGEENEHDPNLHQFHENNHTKSLIKSAFIAFPQLSSSHPPSLQLSAP
jgi:hypothetical protein